MRYLIDKRLDKASDHVDQDLGIGGWALQAVGCSAHTCTLVV